MKRKYKGYMLLSAVLSAVLFLMLANSFFMIYSGQFSTLEAVKTAQKAQRLAEITANTLSLTAYSDLAQQKRRGINGEINWENEILLGSERIIGDGNRQRIATINIYKNGETLARYSLQIPLSSQGAGRLEGSLEDNGWTKLPNGLILQWGKMDKGEWTTVYFPKAFPHRCFSVQVNTIAQNKSSSGLDYVYDVCADRFSAVTWNSAEYYWFAIGF